MKGYIDSPIYDLDVTKKYHIPDFSPAEHTYVDIRESLPTPDFGLAEEYLTGPKASARRLKLWDRDNEALAHR